MSQAPRPGHTIFQGYYYFHHVGLDRNARDIHRDNPHFEHTREFIEKYDMPAFDESYDSMTLDEFEPMVRRVLSRDFRDAGRIAAS